MKWLKHIVFLIGVCFILTFLYGQEPCIDTNGFPHDNVGFLSNCDDGTTGCDCNNVCGGSAFTDRCDNCVGGTTGQTACVQDCNDEWGGTAKIDNCSNCIGGSTGIEECKPDCNGIWDGDAVLDNCQVCDSNPDNNCVQDCSDEWGGAAIIDNCDICVGGTTGKTSCVQDCNEIWGGDAILDNCKTCDNNKEMTVLRTATVIGVEQLLSITVMNVFWVQLENQNVFMIAMETGVERL